MFRFHGFNLTNSNPFSIALGKNNTNQQPKLNNNQHRKGTNSQQPHTTDHLSSEKAPDEASRSWAMPTQPAAHSRSRRLLVRSMKVFVFRLIQRTGRTCVLAKTAGAVSGPNGLVLGSLKGTREVKPVASRL